VQFEIAPKAAQRSIDHFRDRLQAPEYDLFHKGYFYSELTFQLPVIRISEEELLALLISRKTARWCVPFQPTTSRGS
jgi:hypothetical protein